MGPTKFLSGFLIVLSLASSIVGVDRTFENYLNRRQITNCLAPCGPILPAIECPDSSCACTTFNSAGSTALSQCQACIVGAASQYGPIFHVAVDTCSKCQSQCSSIIGVFLRSLSGGATSCDLQCLCAAYASVSPSDVSACTNCLQTVNQSDVTVISQLEQQCQNFTSSTGTVSQSQVATSSTSPISSMGSASTAGSTAATPSVSHPPTSATVAATSTSSKSAATRTCIDVRSSWRQYSFFFIMGGAVVVGCII